MRILLINTVPTEKNGITNVMFNYLRAMNTQGITIDLVSLNKPDDFYMQQIERKGGKVYVIPRLEGVIRYWTLLRKLIRNNQYTK